MFIITLACNNVNSHIGEEGIFRPLGADTLESINTIFGTGNTLAGSRLKLLTLISGNGKLLEVQNICVFILVK